MSTNATVGQAVVGQMVVGQVITAYLFEPPTIKRRLDTTHRLFSRVSLNQGQSVLKDDLGFYTTVENPSPEQIDAAAIAYLGGHVYTVDSSEAASLTAAGYEVTTL